MSGFETPSSNNRIKKALLSLGCSSPSAAAAATPSSSSAADAKLRSSSLSDEWNQDKRTARRGKIIQQRRQNNNINNKNKERMEFSDDSMDFVARHHAIMITSAMDRRFGGGRHDAERIHREIMMFQTRVMSGRMNLYDRYRDWRLDVDRMSYEELLELGDRIGHVNTGLREEDISHSIIKMKLSALNTLTQNLPTEIEKKCSICQEEYEVNEEIGKLECGHGYHMYCIKQWVLQKNACPVCKTAVSKT